MKKILLISLAIVLLFPAPIGAQALRPGNPMQFSVEYVENENPFFLLRWKDEQSTLSLASADGHIGNMVVQINFYIREEDKVIMREMSFPYRDLIREGDGSRRIDLDLVRLGIIEGPVNLMFSSYTFRVRIGLSQQDILGRYTLYGNYSPPAMAGKIFPYSYASPWALEELDKGHQYGLIPESISNNMRDIISREEFAEVMVAYYESVTGEEIVQVGASFKDTDNRQVSKAASLGIIKGYEDGTFRPLNPITRQDIAVVIKRTVQKIDPGIRATFQSVVSSSGISAYAYDSVMFLAYHGILKGDDKNNINPLEHTTREQAVLLTVRSYEHFGQ